jgi:hypothetical protein
LGKLRLNVHAREFRDAAKARGWTTLLRAIAHAESGFDATAVFARCPFHAVDAWYSWSTA